MCTLGLGFLGKLLREALFCHREHLHVILSEAQEDNLSRRTTITAPTSAMTAKENHWVA